ncbi:lyase family protein [Nonomuraea angiospora]|uniref:lyase family protein n=1 Tax=Nonomuraea angiospora TaxID=46172 RepID=UPI0033EA02EF
MSAPGLGSLTGRISRAPATLVDEEVLRPQFDHDVTHLLPFHLRIEKALLAEYARMRVLDQDEVRAVAAALHAVDAGTLTPDPEGNLSDLSFAVEKAVAGNLAVPVPAWRVDRSRNDFQACAQLQLGLALTADVAMEILACAAALHEPAVRYLCDPMPGCTHLQAAQVITPAFFLTAVREHLLHTADRLLAGYDGWNASPLGAGAMSGQRLPWDRHRLARLLAFDRAERHALSSVASRSWLLELAAELATFGVGMSRFLTDLMNWAGGEYAYVELPDELAGISSAMPQKKNYPILERLRGKSTHALAWYVDVAATQRATSFSNSVEVSKESSAQLVDQLMGLRTMLRLTTTVFGALTFRVDRLRERCEQAHLGAFSLANELTLADGVPWREAQVIAGRYIMAERGGPEPETLRRVGTDAGYALERTPERLAHVMSVDGELRSRATTGSAAPSETVALLDEQATRIDTLTADWRRRRRAPLDAARHVDALLGLPHSSVSDREPA